MSFWAIVSSAAGAGHGGRASNRFKDRIRQRTGRSRGVSLERVIADLNPLLRGWFGYFQHARPRIFRYLDGFIRRRLRRFLRQQQGRPSQGRCVNDHRRWPNAYFAERGLFTLYRSSCCGASIPMRKPLTGEPYAGKPHVRFGGRGGFAFPTPMCAREGAQLSSVKVRTSGYGQGPVAEGNCVAREAGWEATGGELAVRRACPGPDPGMTNSIRRNKTTSLLIRGRSLERNRSRCFGGSKRCPGLVVWLEVERLRKGCTRMKRGDLSPGVTVAGVRVCIVPSRYGG